MKSLMIFFTARHIYYRAVEKNYRGSMKTFSQKIMPRRYHKINVSYSQQNNLPHLV